MTDHELQRVRALIEGRRDGATTLIEMGPAGSIRTAKLNRNANVIQDTVLITRNSTNGGAKGRRYSDKALQQIAAMAEGIPAYANHVAPDMAFRPRDVKDIIGRHKNVRYDVASGKVLSDLHLIETHAPWVFSLAERLGDQVGNSLVSKGVVRMEGDTEIVDEIVAVRSGDLVSDPASVVRGLWESQSTLADVSAQRAAELTAILDRIRGVGGPALPEGLHQRLVESGVVVGARPTPATTRPSGDDLHARLAAALTR